MGWCEDTSEERTHHTCISWSIILKMDLGSKKKVNAEAYTGIAVECYTQKEIFRIFSGLFIDMKY